MTDIEDRLRVRLERRATEAEPVDQLRVITSGVVAPDSSSRSHPSRWLLAAVAAIVLILVGALAVVGRGSNTTTSTAGEAPPINHPAEGNSDVATPWRDGVRMVVYVDASATDDAIKFVDDQLASLSMIVSPDGIRYLGPEASLAEATRLLAEEPTTLQLMTVDNVPTAFYVTPFDGVSYDDLAGAAAFIETLPAVTRVDIDPTGRPVIPVDEPPDGPAAGPGTISDEQQAAWDKEGERLIGAKRDAFENGPYDADGQALGFAAQSDPVDIIEPGQYELRFHLDDTARLPDGEYVSGFAINAPPWLTIRYDLGNINVDEDGTMVMELIVPNQTGFTPFSNVTFWVY